MKKTVVETLNDACFLFWIPYIYIYKTHKANNPVKTHKANNPVRSITSGCNTAVENLSIFVEKVLCKEVERIPSRIKDTNHMLDIIDNLNDSDLPENFVLVSFDVVNMFPSIDNESSIKAVKKVLNDRESKKFSY